MNASVPYRILGIVLVAALISILLAYWLAWLGMERLFAGGIGVFAATTFACWADEG